MRRVKVLGAVLAVLTGTIEVRGDDSAVAKLLIERRAILEALRPVAGGIYDNAHKQIQGQVLISAKTASLAVAPPGIEDALIRRIGAAAIANLVALDAAASTTNRADVLVATLTPTTELLAALAGKNREALVAASRLKQSINSLSKGAVALQKNDSDGFSSAMVDAVVKSSLPFVADRWVSRMFRTIANDVLQTTYDVFKQIGTNVRLLAEFSDMSRRHRELILRLGENTRQLQAEGVTPPDALRWSVAHVKAAPPANSTPSREAAGASNTPSALTTAERAARARNEAVVRDEVFRRAGKKLDPKEIAGAWVGTICGDYHVATLVVNAATTPLTGTLELKWQRRDNALDVTKGDMPLIVPLPPSFRPVRRGPCPPAGLDDELEGPFALRNLVIAGDSLLFQLIDPTGVDPTPTGVRLTFADQSRELVGLLEPVENDTPVTFRKRR
jgi:hypothetical protein